MGFPTIWKTKAALKAELRNWRAPARLGLVLALVSLGTGITGCAKQPAAEAPTAAAAGSRPPQRIVTLAPNLTEIVVASGCGDRLVAIDEHSDYPPSVQSLPRVGGMNPSAERILAMQPDVVIAPSAGRYGSLETLLNERGIPLRIVKTDRISELAEAISLLGAQLDCPGARDIAERIAGMSQGIRGGEGTHSALLLASWDPLYVAGHETFADDLLRSAGLRNAVRDGVVGWPLYSLESVLEQPPDLIFVLSSPGRWETTRAQLTAAPGWRELKAVREGHLFMLDEDLASRAGPRVPQVRTLMRAAADEVPRR